MSAAYSLLIGPFESFGFMRTALVACFALALANGPIGTLVLLRRMSLEGDVLSHAVMPGAALGFLYAGYSLAALSLGGFLTGVLVAGSAGLVARFRPKRPEVSLAAFYLVSLALGVIIVSARGSNADLMHVLFGTVLAVDMRNLLFIAIISSAALLVLAAIYRPLAIDSFDPAFLRSIGASGGGVYRGAFVLIVVLNLVASFQAFGTLLAIGPMLLPAAAALCWTQRIWATIALGVAIGMAADCAGLLISYYANLPSGPAIVLAGGAMYGLSIIGTAGHNSISKRLKAVR
jgi:zinc/manganese transport system permease protein